MTRIRDHVRHAVICKMQEHMNIKKVAKDLHLCRSTMRNIWKKFLETGSISDKKKSSRQPLYNVWKIIIICQMVPWLMINAEITI